MHSSSYQEMQALISGLYGGGPQYGRVVDIGSQDVNGSYRELFKDNWEYVGVDAVPGRNVDTVMVTEFDTGLPDYYANLVISGQCLEHCSNPFKLVEEMYRICTHNSRCIIIAPFIWKEHKYPIDCWRFLPDGMNCLFKNAGFQSIKSYIKDADCIGIAKK